MNAKPEIEHGKIKIAFYESILNAYLCYAIDVFFISKPEIEVINNSKICSGFAFYLYKTNFTIYLDR